MVLPATVIGEPAAAHIFDPDSGFQSAADVAEHTLDPHDMAQDIEQAGLRSDYLLSYIDFSGPTVATEVALFDSASQASGFVNTTVGGAEKYEGLSLPNGVEITNVEVTELDGPGDTAYRATVTGAFRGEAITGTLVAFSKDRVAALVSLDAPPETADALALKLSRRIDAVAAGEISETPVSATDPKPTQVGPPDDPLLERMVLAPGDLHAGVTIKSDGFMHKGGDVSFEREFSVGLAPIGRSALIGLQSNVEQMDSAAAASLAVRAVSAVVKGPQGAQLVADAFGQGAGFDADSIRIRELSAAGIGDRTTALRATFATRLGTFEAVFVFIAVGRAAGQIYAAGAKGKVDPDDILALARTMARKMEAGR